METLNSLICLLPFCPLFRDALCTASIQLSFGKFLLNHFSVVANSKLFLSRSYSPVQNCFIGTKTIYLEYIKIKSGSDIFFLQIL